MRVSVSSMTPRLTASLFQLLKNISSSRTMPLCLVKRAKIFLMASEGKSNKEISCLSGYHENTVSRWRNRFLKALPRLEAVEKEQSENLCSELKKTLSDEKRPGAPPVYTADQRAFIITVACQDPEDHGFELSHWNLSALRLAVINKGIVADISVSQISRILIENEVQPHKNQYWLHSADKEEDPEVYKAKVKAVNHAYALAKELYEADTKTDTCIVSTDEMTGVQALERRYPDKRAIPGSMPKQEFEYIRHGTVSMSAFMDVVTGKIFEPYLNTTRTEEDFVSALNQVIKTDPKKKWIIIADNLNTHYSASLVEYIAKEIDYKGLLGKKRKEGILENKVSRIRFLTDPSHRIRFIYTPKHCSWLNQIEIWFGIINRQLLKRKSYISVDKLVQSIRNYVDQYNRLFAHPFNWKYNTTPLGD